MNTRNLKVHVNPSNKPFHFFCLSIFYDFTMDDQDKAKLDKIRKSYVIKQKTLILSTRGITFRYRHLMKDLLDLLPHAKKDSKLDTKQALWVLNEVCDMKGCNNCIFFEVRKGTDLFLWMAKVPHGPSIKFHILNGMYRIFDRI